MAVTGASPPAARSLRVLIADEDPAALERLRAVLEEQLGHDVVSFAVSAAEAAALIEREDPDLAFVMVHHDDDHALRLISSSVACASGPVIAHAGNGHDADPTFAERAAERGVSAFVASDDPASVQAAIEVALRRHRERSALAEKVQALEDALERRATIERAKGILMERHSVDADEAFGLLRSHARSHARRVAEVAAAVVEGHALLPRR